MATKPAKKQEQTAVVVQRPQLPAEWMAEMAKEAKAVVATETPSIGNISFKSGVMAYQGTPIPGNNLDCIVVGTAFERCLYEGAYDPNKIKSPICFALSLDGEDMAPHANSLKKQNDTCKGCPMDEWGSAGENRRGKACKEIRRLALIPSDKLESANDINSAELAMAKVPVTSVRNWSNHVHKVSATLNLPFWAVITNMALQPHIKNQFEVIFEVQDTIDDITALGALKHKRNLVEPFVMAPYSVATEDEEQPAPKPKAKKKF